MRIYLYSFLKVRPETNINSSIKKNSKILLKILIKILIKIHDCWPKPSHHLSFLIPSTTSRIRTNTCHHLLQTSHCKTFAFISSPCKSHLITITISSWSHSITVKWWPLLNFHHSFIISYNRLDSTRLIQVLHLASTKTFQPQPNT